LRILALVAKAPQTSPGQRYRIEQWEPHLRAQDIVVEAHAFESPALTAILYEAGQGATKAKLMARDYRRRARLLSRLEPYDAAYVYLGIAPLGPPVFERLLRRRHLPFVFDFDDAVFLSQRSEANGWMSLLKYPPKTRTSCRLASHVMAGNQYLAEFARRFNQDVSTVPTGIDLVAYRPAATPPSDCPVIGWTGSHSTMPYLAILGPALQRLARTHLFRLRVIADVPFSLPGVDVENIPWRHATEVEDLAPADVGVMPLPDNRWTRGKCGLKALQYMALAIPAVCSPVGVNVDIVSHDQNGLLADSEDEWVAKLGNLLDSPETRERLGRAGRITVEQRFDGADIANRVAGIFRSVARARADAPASGTEP
jgi:glycosyltransferase involved in cell wall biosynthesis